MNASTDFVVAFLGALFAILVALLIVYTYVMLRLVPKLTRGFRDFIDKHANMDPAEALRQFGVAPAAFASGPAAPSVRVVYTCDDHGRCVGCPKVLAQFEAIIRHQGEDTFDEVERRCYAPLKEQFWLAAARSGCEAVEKIEEKTS